MPLALLLGTACSYTVGAASVRRDAVVMDEPTLATPMTEAGSRSLDATPVDLPTTSALDAALADAGLLDSPDILLPVDPFIGDCISDVPYGVYFPDGGLAGARPARCSELRGMICCRFENLIYERDEDRIDHGRV